MTKRSARRSAAAGPRQFRLYRDGRLALDIRNEPGILVSTSAPPPLPGHEPATHPFATGTAYVAEWEGELGTMLRAATSMEDFLEAARAAGYEVRAADD